MMLALVGHSEGNLGLIGAEVPVVPSDGNEPAVVLSHERQAVPIVHMGESLDLSRHQVRMEVEEPEVARTIGQVFVEVNKRVHVVRTDGTHPETELLQRDGFKFQLDGIGVGSVSHVNPERRYFSHNLCFSVHGTCPRPPNSTHVAAGAFASIIAGSVVKDDSSRDLLGGDRDNGVSISSSPGDDPMLGVLDELIRMIHNARTARHDHTPALAEGIVNAIDLKTNLAVRFEFHCLLHRRMKENFAAREPKVHWKRNRSATCAKHDPPHTPRLEVSSTFGWCQGFKNGSRYRSGPARGRVPVSTKEARRRRQEDTRNRGQCLLS